MKYPITIQIRLILNVNGIFLIEYPDFNEFLKTIGVQNQKG